MMKVTIIVKEEHAELLYKVSKGELSMNDDNVQIDWATFSNYAKGFLTVQIDYELYVTLLDSSN